MSTLKNMDWFEPIEEYTPDNKIIDILEENDDDTDISTYRNFDIDFDESSFSIWADL